MWLSILNTIFLIGRFLFVNIFQEFRIINWISEQLMKFSHQ